MSDLSDVPSGCQRQLINCVTSTCSVQIKLLTTIAMMPRQKFSNFFIQVLNHMSNLIKYSFHYTKLIFLKSFFSLWNTAI